MHEKLQKPPAQGIDVQFIARMVNDEMDELKQATTIAQRVDACLDAVYYILQHMSASGVIPNAADIKLNNVDADASVTDIDVDAVLAMESLTTLQRLANHTEDNKIDNKLVADNKDSIADTKDSIPDNKDSVADNKDSIISLLTRLVADLLNHIADANIQYESIWDLIHLANMTKFGPGGHLEEIIVDGQVQPGKKWCKPPDFVPPDADIEKEIQRQMMKLY